MRDAASHKSRMHDYAGTVYMYIYLYNFLCPYACLLGVAV
jgi:hypothetical protein